MARGFSTTTMGSPEPSASAAPSASVTIATAPFAAAAGANSAPWRLTPRIATNASPARRSAVARVIPLSSTPDVSPREDCAKRATRSCSDRTGGCSGRRTGGRFEGAASAVGMAHPSSHPAVVSPRGCTGAAEQGHGPLLGERGYGWPVTAIAFLIGILVLVVGLAVSIALHELGHLLPAKRFGVRVGQYMIGFGPTIWSKRKGETEYGFKAIPLGGYISMAGMYPPSPRLRKPASVGASAAGMESGRSGRAGGGFFATMVQDAQTANDDTLEGADDQRVFYRLPVWKRVVIMLGGPA